MARAESQAKQLALKAMNTMTIHPPHVVTSTPEVHIRQTGVKHTNIIQNQPQYTLTIGETDKSGFKDLIDEQLQEDIGVSETAYPGS